MEKTMAPHSSTLAWKIPWTEEPGRLQSMGSLRVGHDWATSLSLSCIGEGNGNHLQCSCLENPRDGGALVSCVYGVAQSRTQLKRLSSSSRIHSNFNLGRNLTLSFLSFFYQSWHFFSVIVLLLDFFFLSLKANLEWNKNNHTYLLLFSSIIYKLNKADYSYKKM